MITEEQILQAAKKNIGLEPDEIVQPSDQESRNNIATFVDGVVWLRNKIKEQIPKDTLDYIHRWVEEDPESNPPFDEIFDIVEKLKALYGE